MTRKQEDMRIEQEGHHLRRTSARIRTSAKNQPTAAQKQPATAQTSRRQNRKSIQTEKNIYKSGYTAEEIHPLWMLAESAALLLESENNLFHQEENNQGHEGQCLGEKSLALMWGNTSVEAEENGSYMQKRIRLIHIKRLARLQFHERYESEEKGHCRKYYQAQAPHQLTLLGTETEGSDQSTSLQEAAQASGEDLIVEIPSAEPLMVMPSEMQEDPRYAARTLRKLRSYKMKTKRAVRQMEKAYEAEGQWLSHAMMNGTAANQHDMLHIANMQQQQQILAAQLRRASQDAYHYLYSCPSREESHVHEGPAERDQRPSLELVVHEQAATNTEAQDNNPRAKTRFTQIKREASLKHARPVERNHGLELDHPTNAGNQSGKGKGIML